MEKPRLDQRPEARTFAVEKLLQYVQAGKIRIPDFQRPLRWRSSHVLDLFDSVYCGFPVGDLLLSKGPGSPGLLHFGPLHVRAPQTSDAFMVVDGQQRITALAGAMLHPEKRPRGDIHAVWFDLESERFVRLQSTEPPPHWIPVNVVGDSFVLLNWLNEWPFRAKRPDLVQRAIELGKALREYQIPAYVVEGASEDILRLIFKRANTSGAKMQESEVFEALFDGKGPRPIEGACARLQEETGFGQISHDWFLRCLKVVEGLDLRRRFGEREGDMSMLQPEPVERTESALRRTIAFLSEDAGMIHAQLLPYRLPLVVLARFFDQHPRPHPRTRALLVRWVWRGAISGYHTNSSDASVQQLQSLIGEDEFAAVEGLLRTVPIENAFPGALTAWYGQSARARLCAIALAHLGPRDPESGEPLGFDDLRALLDQREIGRVFLDAGPKGESTVARRLLLPERRKLRDLARASDSVLQSHGLDKETASLLHMGSLGGQALDDFERRRAQILEPWLKRFFAERSRMRENDRPPIAELVRRANERIAAG
jgi:Protein of unknown function DUF262